MTDATERSTWYVNLWLNNEYNDYRHWSALATELVETRGVETFEELTEDEQRGIVSQLASHIKDDVERHPLADQSSLYSDLLTYVLACVDWRDVARGFLEE